MHLAAPVKYYPRTSAFPFAANVIFSDILKEYCRRRALSSLCSCPRRRANNTLNKQKYQIVVSYLEIHLLQPIQLETSTCLISMFPIMFPIIIIIMNYKQ